VSRGQRGGSPTAANLSAGNQSTQKLERIIENKEQESKLDVELFASIWSVSFIIYLFIYLCGWNGTESIITEATY
jgi:hypothetical protein